MSIIENDAECKIDGLAKDRFRVECLGKGRRTESNKRCLDEEPNPSLPSMASSRTSNPRIMPWRRAHGHFHDHGLMACWKNTHIITTGHKYERFVRILDHTSISKFWVPRTKVCIKFCFTHIFQNSYLFFRLRAILESVSFRNHEVSRVRTLKQVLVVWRLLGYEFYEECPVSGQRHISHFLLSSLMTYQWGHIILLRSKVRSRSHWRLTHQDQSGTICSGNESLKPSVCPMTWQRFEDSKSPPNGSKHSNYTWNCENRGEHGRSWFESSVRQKRAR